VVKLCLEVFVLVHQVKRSFHTELDANKQLKDASLIKYVVQMETVSAHQVKSRLNGSQDATQQAHPAYLDRLSVEVSALAQQVSGRPPLVLDVRPTSQHAAQDSTEMQLLADAHAQLDRQ